MGIVLFAFVLLILINKYLKLQNKIKFSKPFITQNKNSFNKGCARDFIYKRLKQYGKK